MKNIIFIAFASALFLSCEFEIDETVFTEVKQPASSDLETVVFADSMDSIYVYKKIHLIFDVDLKEFELYEISLFIDGQPYEVLQSGPQISFELDPAEFTNGAHTFVLRGFTSTETNSLADVVGAEYFEITKEFQVFIDLAPPISITIDSIYVANGTINIEWRKPKKSNYINLQIISKVYTDCGEPDCGFYGKNVGIAKNLDKSSEFFQDFDYNGMKVAYAIDIEGYNYHVEGILKNFELSPVKVFAEYRNNSTIYFKWDSLMLYKNNLSIQINDGPSTKHADLELSKTGEYQDEVEIELGFVEYFYFTLDSENDNPYRSAGNYFKRFEFFPGEKFQAFREMKYAVGTNKMYLVRPGDSKIYKYDFESLAIEDSSSFIAEEPFAQDQLFVSQDGNVLYYKFEEYFYKVDPITLDQLKKIDISQILGRDRNWIYTNEVSISNNQLMSFEMLGTQYLVDLENETLVSELPTISGFESIINSNGDKYVYRDSLYSIEGNTLKLEGSVSSPILNPSGLSRLSVIGFIQSGNEFMYYDFKNYITYVFDTNLMEVVRSFSSPSKWSLDIISEKFYSTSHEEYKHDEGKMNVYDLNGNFVRSFDTYDSHTAGWYFLLQGNKVFSYRGQVYEF